MFALARAFSVGVKLGILRRTSVSGRARAQCNYRCCAPPLAARSLLMRRRAAADLINFRYSFKDAVLRTAHLREEGKFETKVLYGGPLLLTCGPGHVADRAIACAWRVVARCKLKFSEKDVKGG